MKRRATAVWSGTLVEGGGTLNTQSGALKNHPYAFGARFKDESGLSGTNPEELLAAAHAGCFAMQLSSMLAKAGTPAETLDVKAVVTFNPKEEGGFEIVSSELELEGTVPEIEEQTFLETAEQAKATCPVSVALGAITVSLSAKLA